MSNSNEKQAFTPLLMAGMGAGYGAGAAPKGELLSNMTHHGLRGAGTGLGAQAGAVLAGGLAGKAMGNPYSKMSSRQKAALLASMLGGSLGGAILGNRGTKALLGSSPGERKKEEDRKIEEYYSKMSSDQYLEKEAKFFGYLDDIARGVGTGARYVGNKLSGGFSSARQRAGSPKVQEFLRGQKGFKRKPANIPYPQTRAGFTQPSGGPATSTIMGELANRAGKNTANLAARAKNFLYQPGQGAISTLLRGGALGAGGLAAKDLATLPFGGWDNKDSYGGMRRGGLDYQRQQIDPRNTGLLNAALSAGFSPLKSLASLGLGDPDANPTGIESKYLGTSPEGIARYQRTKVPVGARASRSARELQGAQTKLQEIKSNLQSEIAKAKESLSSGDFPSAGGGLFSGRSEAEQRAMGRAALQARIKEMEQQLRSGEYRDESILPFGIGDSASARELQQQIDERQRYLRNLGILSAQQSRGLRQPYDNDRVRRRVMAELGY